MSGQHVVYGFLRPTARWMLPEHSITVLHYESEQPPHDLLDAGVQTRVVSDRYRDWVRRAWWELRNFGSVSREIGADVVLSVSGAVTPGCPVPQAVLCQNPWCYIPQAQFGWQQRFKARLQRLGYAKAFRNADMMIYLSGHLRSLYQQGNPGVTENRADIANVGLNQDTFDTASEMSDAQREPFSILSVSAMAPWKGAETLVEAVHRLHQRSIPATLKFVGPWPVESYHQRIKSLIAAHSLDDHVQILGKVSDEELHRLYATSRVFSLMSCCESFGIPAAEAMAFGTPIVSTNCCAIAEICEGAGRFGSYNDPEWTANALESALVNDAQWKTWSDVARSNASRLDWQICSKAFTQIPELVKH